MKVVYITKQKVFQLPMITYFKVYDIVTSCGTYYTIIDDFGNNSIWSRDNFLTLDEFRTNQINTIL